MFVVFFFSSRRRHTRCALVTGVQTCALPISSGIEEKRVQIGERIAAIERAVEAERLPARVSRLCNWCSYRRLCSAYCGSALTSPRSEERRVGKECVSTFRFRGSAYL